MFGPERRRDVVVETIVVAGDRTNAHADVEANRSAVVPAIIIVVVIVIAAALLLDRRLLLGIVVVLAPPAALPLPRLDSFITWEEILNGV
jgi:hypothetical protein